MNSYKLFETAKIDADELKHDQMTFHKPFKAVVLEGGSNHEHHNDMEHVAILSSN